MLGHIKHLQLSEGDCGFQSPNHHVKMQNNGYVAFFLALSGALQEFHCYLKIPQGFLIFVVPHSVPYLKIPHLLLGAYILYDEWTDFFVYLLRENFRPDIDTSCVKFCGTTIWPRLYSPCSILSFRISMTCWFDCPTGKGISLQFGILNLNLEKMLPLTYQASQKEFLKWNSCELLISDSFVIPQKVFVKALEAYTKIFWSITKKWKERCSLQISILCPRLAHLRVKACIISVTHDVVFYLIV